MKKILFILIIISIFPTVYGQELSEGLQAKNDGNAAFKNEDYVGAISKWEKYLNSDEESAAADENTKSLYVKAFKYAADDFMIKKKNYSSAYSYYEKYVDKAGDEAKNNGEITYKMAYCANKMNKDDLALSLYQKCEELGYKGDVCVLYIANIYKNTGDDAKMITVLKDGMKKYATSKNKSKMAKMLTIPMLKDAAAPFNQANELAKAASTGDPAEYLSNMSKAVSKFEVAIPLFEEVLQYDPANDQAKTYINACKDNIKSFNDYKANLSKK